MDDNQALALASGGQVTQGFSDVTMRSGGSGVAIEAQMAREQAIVQSRYAMAIKMPRDMDTFRVKLLKEASRPGLAEVAEYNRPVGKEKDEITGEWVEKRAKGPTIHLLRVALALYGNNGPDVSIVSETATSRTCRVTLSDYETNYHPSKEFTFSKLIEKKGFKKKGKEEPPDRPYISTRVNTYGDTVYICPMNLDEIRKEENRLAALTKRAVAEEFLPRDIVREALAKAVEVKNAEIKRDPDAAKKRILDKFAEIQVPPAELLAYIGHPLDRLTPDELDDLRGIWSAINDNETTWRAVMESKDPSGTTEDAEKVKADKLAALRSTTVTNTAQQSVGNGGGKSPSGEEKIPTSSEQPAVGTTGTVGAPAPEPGAIISAEQAKEFAKVIEDNKLDDAQVAMFVKAGGADRYDHMKVELFDTVLKMAKATKGKARK